MIKHFNSLPSVFNKLNLSQCHLCQQKSKHLLCKTCLSDISPINYSEFDGNLLNNPLVAKAFTKQQFPKLFAPTEYRWPIDHLLKSLKFSNKINLAEPLANIFYQAFKKSHVSQPLPEAIIPIPLHTLRYVSRKYNQSYEIAKYLGKLSGIPVLDGVCSRIRFTKAQSNLELQKRKPNVANAFQCSSLEDFSHVAILDDVVTTGHTVDSLYQCLKTENPHLLIEVWALSVSLPHQ